MPNYLIVFIGSGLGGVLRYLMSPAVQRLANWFFPIGTLSVNIVGCILIGFIAQLAESYSWLSPEARAFLLIGLIGGFTTFSTFAYETTQLIRDGSYLYALLNMSLQVVFGILAVCLGQLAAKLIL